MFATPRTMTSPTLSTGTSSLEVVPELVLSTSTPWFTDVSLIVTSAAHPGSCFSGALSEAQHEAAVIMHCCLLAPVSVIAEASAVSTDVSTAASRQLGRRGCSASMPTRESPTQTPTSLVMGCAAGMLLQEQLPLLPLALLLLLLQFLVLSTLATNGPAAKWFLLGGPVAASASVVLVYGLPACMPLPDTRLATRIWIFCSCCCISASCLCCMPTSLRRLSCSSSADELVQVFFSRSSLTVPAWRMHCDKSSLVFADAVDSLSSSKSALRTNLGSSESVVQLPLNSSEGDILFNASIVPEGMT
mmetsp:Transcript_38328/g.76002  ORF Transcript_38328/g.76002 Transcript_38328/m.76002 type:complete len:303 (-) Transcript_38328:1603-2511(-)